MMARRKTQGLGRAALVLAVAFAAAVPAARADSAAEFYKGKTVTLMVGLPPGGAYGLYARLVAEHMPRHILGNPAMVTQFRPGAGGLTVSNHMYNAAPRDGLHLGLLAKDVAVAQVLRPDSVRYDARRFNWIGSVAPFTAVVVVSDKAGVRTLEDAKTREVLMGALGGRATGSFILPTLLNALVGTKFKIIQGYEGAAGMTLAMDRGETHGWAGGSWMGFKGPRQQDVKDGRVIVLVQTGVKRQPELPDVPLLRELSDDPGTQRIFELIDSGENVGFSISAPPEVPADRVAALRRAFDAMVRDPAFLADAERLNADVDPMSGPELAAMVERALSTPPEVARRTRELLGL